MKKSIRYLIMDVDGTLTDGKIYIGNNGEVFKAFNIKDGCGIHDIAIPNGIVPVIITGRSSQIVLNRCRELGIDRVYQGITDKKSKIADIVNDLSEVAYIGDDINDLACIELVRNGGGLIGCPADAVQEVKALAHYICKRNGGDGAVRDYIEWLVNEK